MNFLELIDAHATATAEARTAQNLSDIEHWVRETFTLRAEIERRINLAGADHHLAIWCHLEGGERSRDRQRNLLNIAEDDRKAGRTVERAVQYIEQSIVDEWKAKQP